MGQIDLNRRDLFEDEEEIIKVRIAKFEEWKRQEEEAKKKIRVEKEFAERATEIQKKNKEYGGKNVTADSNGVPVYIKPTSTEKLLSDFLFSRSIVFDRAPLEKEVKLTEERKKRTDNSPKKDNPNKDVVKGNSKEYNNKDKDKDAGNKVKENVIINTSLAIKDAQPQHMAGKRKNDGRKQTISDRNGAKSPKYQPPQITFVQPMGSNYE